MHTALNFRPTKANATFLSSIFFVAVALIFGGGGSHAALAATFCQLAAMPLLMLALLEENDRAALPIKARIPLYLMFAVAAFCAMQLIPLPPVIWEQLPGRELSVATADILGDDRHWRPISINPEHSLQTILYLVCPIAAFLAFTKLNQRQRFFLVIMISAIAVLAMVLTLMQSLSADGALRFYSNSHNDLTVGFFANRNHNAVFLLIGMLFCVKLVVSWRKPYPLFASLAISVIAAILFAVAVLSTNSRSGAALLAPALLYICWDIAGLLSRGRERLKWFMGGGLAVFVSAIFFATSSIPVFVSLRDRFLIKEEHRFEFWGDAVTAMQSYFPVGSGLGTFREAFEPFEPLRHIGTQYVNHAHNDYLEVLLELGLFGAIFILVALGWLGFMAANHLRRGFLSEKEGRTDYAMASVLCLFLLAAHSWVDYPLRTIAISTLAAMCAAILALGFHTEDKSASS